MNFDDWEHVKHVKMKKIAEKSNISEISLKNEYFHVKTREELLAVLERKESNKTSAFTQQINQAIRTQTKRRSLTSYLEKKKDHFDSEKFVSEYEKMIRRLEKWDVSNEKQVVTKSSEESRRSNVSKNRIISTLQRQDAESEHDKLS